MRELRAAEVDEVQELFSQIMRNMRRLPTKKILLADTTFAQIKVLWLLQSRDSCTMGDVAGMLGVTRPTATSIVNRLVSKGFIRRDRDKRDRRVVRLKLLRKGSALLDTRRDAFRERISGMLRPLTGEDRRRFIKALRVVRSMIDKSSDRFRERR